MPMKFSENSCNVRTMIEFLLRHGDIMPGDSFFSPERALLGSEIHRKMQSKFKSENPCYVAEKHLSYSCSHGEINLTVEGRCDGFYLTEDILHVDEIKTIEYSLTEDDSADQLHIAQTACYAAMLRQNAEFYTEKIELHIIYININDNTVLKLTESYSGCELDDYFQSLIAEYFRWLIPDAHRKALLSGQLKELKFPFDSYRKGQRELAVAIYKTITENTGQNLYINAPTGIGKTVSMLFPALKAMDKPINEIYIKKIFYLTATNAGCIPPQDATILLSSQLKSLFAVTLTSKEKICPNENPECHPEKCERAKGHYNRINACLYEAVTDHALFTRDYITHICRKYCVCPFEMQLDLSMWCDIIIGDYNYLFDPTAKLQRYFGDLPSGDKKLPYIYLVDEAHNLPSRAREMYSATLNKSQFMQIARLLKDCDTKPLRNLKKKAMAISKRFTEISKEADEFPYCRQTPDGRLLELCADYSFAAYGLLKKKNAIPEEIHSEFIELYFNIRFFCEIGSIFDSNFYSYFEKDYSYTLYCVNPSEILSKIGKSGLNATFFSGTLLPFEFYVHAIGGEEDQDRLIKIPSPFPKENRLTVAAGDVYTTYSKRADYYSKIASYIKMLQEYAEEKCSGKGNFMVFFSSYKFLNDVLEVLDEDFCRKYISVQPRTKKQEEREAFIDGFEDNPKKIRIGLCVLGGVFSEGIDLPGSRLLGVLIVGVGLPMVSIENELIYKWYETQKEGSGFENAYVFPGINKVIQAAGRVIRTMNDKGFVILLDNRYLNNRYSSLLPPDYTVKKAKNIAKVKEILFDLKL